MSKYDPYEEQIKTLVAQGKSPKQINDILNAQGIDSNYSAFYWWYARRWEPKRKKVEVKNMNLVETAAAARREGMTYGQYEGRRYSMQHPLVRKW